MKFTLILFAFMLTRGSGLDEDRTEEDALTRLMPLLNVFTYPLPSIEDRKESEIDATMSDIDADTSQLKGIGSKIWDLLGRHREKPWWQKENVCIENLVEEEKIPANFNDDNESIIIGSTINIGSCYSTDIKYECVNKITTPTMSKTTTTTYKCCYSHMKINNRCVKIDLVPLEEKIKELNGTEFLKLAFNNDINLKNGNFTIFLPSNEAFKDFADEMLQTNRLELVMNPVRRRRSPNVITASELIRAHIAESFNEMGNNGIRQYDEITSLLDTPLSITQKKFEQKYVVNCARIFTTNNYAINGVVHTIDKVLVPIEFSIMDIIRQRKEFSIVKLLLEKTELAKTFTLNEKWTFFAPTNNAFNRLQSSHPDLMKKLLRGDNCTINMLRHHILYQSFCSKNAEPVISQLKNVMDRHLVISEKPDSGFNTKEVKHNGIFYVENAAVTETDIVATNGVIHALDDVIIPKSALPVTTLLSEKHSMFHDLVMKAHIGDVLDNMTNVTFIIPTNDALKNYYKDENNEDDEAVTKGYDMKELRTFILNHVIAESIPGCEFENNVKKPLMSKSSSVRINLYSTTPFKDIYNRATINCARLVHLDTQQCGNMIHQISKPIEIADKTIMEKIKNHPNLTMLHKVIEGSEVEKILNNETLSITFLAPEDSAFLELSPEDYEDILKNKDLADVILIPHIFKDVMCCAGLEDIMWPFKKTLETYNDDYRTIGKNRIGNATISSCDIVGTNGVMHTTKTLTLPTKVLSPKKNNPNIFLFGVNI